MPGGSNYRFRYTCIWNDEPYDGGEVIVEESEETSRKQRARQLVRDFYHDRDQVQISRVQIGALLGVTDEEEGVKPTWRML